MNIPTNSKGLIATGGGKKELSSKDRYFLALQKQHIRWAAVDSKDDSILWALNMLVSSKGQMAPETFDGLKSVAAAGKRIYLDSGCYTLANAYANDNGLVAGDVFMSDPATLPFFEEWFSVYKKWVVALEPYLWGYVEVDFGNYEQRCAVRQRCYDETGLIPIPVFRVGRDPFSVFEELITTYDRVCIAGTLHLTSKQHARAYISIYETWKRLNPDCYIHVLGIGAFGSFSRYNLPSSDSSTYANAARYGLTCGYCYAGFAHAAHFTPKFSMVNGISADTVCSSTVYGSRIGVIQHSIYSLGRKAHLASIESVKRSYKPFHI
jgi:hypothetical protein